MVDASTVSSIGFLVRGKFKFATTDNCSFRQDFPGAKPTKWTEIFDSLATRINE
jgi:hypothetical protein